jgi:hypothetical protein
MVFTNLSFACRTLRTRPALSVTSVGVLTAGLGFSIAAFSIVNTRLFRQTVIAHEHESLDVRKRVLAEGACQGNREPESTSELA